MSTQDLKKPLTCASPAELPDTTFPLVFSVDEAQRLARRDDKPIVVLFATRLGGVGGGGRY